MFTLFFSIIILSLILLPFMSVACNFKSFLGLNSCPSSISKSIPLIDDLSTLFEVLLDILLLLLLLELEFELPSSGSVENPSPKVCLEYSVSSLTSVFIVPVAEFLFLSFSFDASSSIFSILFALLERYLLVNITPVGSNIIITIIQYLNNLLDAI